MDISAAFEILFARPTVSDMIDAFDSSVTVNCTKATYSKYLKELKTCLEGNNAHRCVALALALSQSKKDQAIWDMREKGYFRLSRYGFENSACETVDALIAIEKKIAMKHNALDYLSSVQALHSLRSQIIPLYSYISDQLERYKKTALKSMFVVIDRMFLGAWPGGDKHLPSDHPLHHSMEDFAEAFSTVLGIFKTRHGVSLSSWQNADPDGLKESNIYLFILTAAAQLNSFKQAEVMLDGLPYKAELKAGNVHISSADSEFEKTVRLGYIQQDKQSAIRQNKVAEIYHSSPQKPPSIIKASEELFNKGLSRNVFIKEKPQRRLVFAIPQGYGVEELVGFQGLYIEEIMSIMNLDVDDFSEGDILEKEIKPGINIGHLLRFQRFFTFILCVYELALENISEEDKAFITAQSVINIIPREALINSLSLALPKDIATELLDMLLLSDKRELIDIQYFPLISAENEIICSARVCSASNVARNIYVSNRLHKGWKKGGDPMVLALGAALKAAGFVVEIEVDLPFGEDLDADVLAYKDGLLLVLECKHAYHPCNMHELRNTLWHVNKGVDQLNVRLPYLSSKENLDALFASIHWDSIKVDEIRGAIVTSTRVLHGWRPGGHPVIQAKEFINVLTRGEIAGPEGVYSFWQGEMLTADDVRSYLDGTTIIGDQLETLEPRLEVHPYGENKLIFETWKSNEEMSGEIFKQKYKYTSHAEK